ncbi:MAG: glycosyltransferase [Candidatus Omnitrophota bacterium]
MKNLEIYIITYNRSGFLKNILNSLTDISLKDCKITVLNNCSTDDTESVCGQFKKSFADFNLVSHKCNIGAGANCVRAIEMSSSLYTWVLCDDDYLDPKDIGDISAIIEEGAIDLIHVGAHPSGWNHGGEKLTPKQLMEKGYHYFKFGSFLPCNIFKTKKFQNNIESAYANLANSYPHFPYLVDMYESSKEVYVSKKQIVTAKTSGQYYDCSTFLLWWMGSCRLLKDRGDVHLAFFDQFSGEQDRQWLISHMKTMWFNQESTRKVLNNFVDDFFTKTEKQTFYDVIKMHIIKNRIKNFLGTKLYYSIKPIYRYIKSMLTVTAKNRCRIME